MPDLANIGPLGVRRRHRLGMAGLAAGVVATVLLTLRQGPLWHILVTAPLFWAASLGLLQARAKT